MIAPARVSLCRVVTLVIALAVGGPLAGAQRRPISFEELGRILKIGQPVLLIRVGGLETRGEFVSVSTAEIVLRINQTTLSTPASVISRIEVPRRARWSKGLWIGGALGALGVLALGEGSAKGLALIGALGAGLGAAIGAARDLARPSRIVIYSATATRIGPSVICVDARFAIEPSLCQGILHSKFSASSMLPVPPYRATDG